MNLNKKEIIKLLVNHLESNLDSLVNNALEAKQAATSEEAKAENKYDTRGLEASYLAGAQAKRATDLKETIYSLSKLEPKTYDKNSSVASTAIVLIENADGEKKYFFLLPVAGGYTIDYKGIKIQSLNISAPLANALLNTNVQDIFSIKIGETDIEYEVLDIC